jgi:hypothetical protein
MIDGTQLLTMFAICFYMAIGAIVGFVAALFIVPGYCILHPLVLAWWERYRMIVEVRQTTRLATKILADKIKDVDLQATKEVLKEIARDRSREHVSPPPPPPNEKFRKGG